MPTDRAVAPPTRPTDARALAAEFGSPLLTLAQQWRLPEEQGFSIHRSGDDLLEVTISYWYLEHPEAPVGRDQLWDAVRTSRPTERGMAIAEATAAHLEHIVKNLASRPEHMSFEQWVRWNPIPAVRPVRDTTLTVRGRRQPAVSIAHPPFVALGTLVDGSIVTVAGRKSLLATLELALVDRSVTAERQ